MGDKSDTAFALVSGLVKRMAPIYGVGFQTHRLSTESPTFYSEVDQNIKRIAALGLKVAITELDVRVPIPATSIDYANQARNYAEILRVALKNKNSIETFVIWGLTDKYYWVPSTFPSQGDALPFDVKYNAKPAYDSLVSVLQTSCGNITALEEGIEKSENFTSAPNPFTSKTTLIVPGKFDYTVYDLKGIQVAQGSGSNTVEIGSNLKAGLYTVKILNNNSEINTIKVLKSEE